MGRLIPAALLACSVVVAVSAVVAPGGVAQATIRLPPANGQFDYQIGGAYKPLAATKIVERDRHDAPAAGKYNICYVNAFQTQLEEQAWWTTRHPDLLLRAADGSLVGDPEWGEILFDTRTTAKRQALASIMTSFMNSCASRGYRAVELDNLDTFTRSNGLLSYAANRTYARLLTVAGHKRGLAMAQKNTPDQSKDLKAIGFDFAIAEQCQVYGECGEYTAVYRTEVFEIEYTSAAYTAACKAVGTGLSVIQRDLDIVPRGTAGYAYRSC
jgi:hypothetical protein